MFDEANFIMYKVLPFYPYEVDLKTGFFSEFDRWNTLMFLDIILFISNLFAVAILCIGSVYPGEFIVKELCGVDRKGKKDFMESEIEKKKLVL